MHAASVARVRVANLSGMLIECWDSLIWRLRWCVVCMHLDQWRQ